MEFTLSEILSDIKEALVQIDAKELLIFENNWKLLTLYAVKPEATLEGFQFLLKEIISANPTLSSQRFPVLLSGFSTRFSPKPGQEKKAMTTQGMPAVYNAVLSDISKLLEEIRRNQTK